MSFYIPHETKAIEIALIVCVYTKKDERELDLPSSPVHLGFVPSAHNALIFSQLAVNLE
ncbi:hypothetical protein EV213_11553 [Aureibacillus halotolerans]|uniref:Uncharacterized protein n=1 Tax=Aureibacillus halotolerans TaxID=1508390 RepID=A0A4R6TTG8_9BACI|nr:hypothetical protein EV213_11553 [Aureibacillus halotolerans]